jgi:CPA2 family monovalent cation:H+ antiporter-2
MALVVPMLGGTGGPPLEIVWALAKALAIIVVVLLFARRLMPKVLETVALTCSPELFLLTVIAICFGTAYLTSLAGVSLSLGAFLAGLLVSESRFSEHALGETMPLQILFSATFFVSVGLLLDLRFLWHNPLLVLSAIFLVLIVKVLTTGVGIMALGYKLPVAVASSLMLAQIGEFSFVLERAGREAGLTPAGMETAGSQAFIATSVVLMIMTPFLSQFGVKLSERLAKRKDESEAEAMEINESPSREISQLENHVIVGGYGQAARRLVRVLSGSKIPYIITTLSPGGANEAEGEGLPVIRGDASKQHTLILAGMERAKVMVIADDDLPTSHRITSVARALNPTMRIIVRTRYITDIDPLREVGADMVIAEELESIVQLFAEVLRDYQIPAQEIEAHEEAVRSGGYAALLSEKQDAAPVVVCHPGEDCFGVRTVVVRADAPANGKSIAELELEESFGVTLRSIHRAGRERKDLTPDMKLRTGDELVIGGSSDAFIRVAPIFRTSPLMRETSAQALPDGFSSKFDFESAVQLNVARPHPVCKHLDQTRSVIPSARGCEDCLRTGDVWVHLRICMTCGHVGCCDSSKNKHATKHARATGHPIIKSLEPGEDWAWCYLDETIL